MTQNETTPLRHNLSGTFYYYKRFAFRIVFPVFKIVIYLSFKEFHKQKSQNPMQKYRINHIFGIEFGLKITFSWNDPNASLAFDDIGRIGAHDTADLPECR